MRQVLLTKRSLKKKVRKDSRIGWLWISCDGKKGTLEVRGGDSLGNRCYGIRGV